MKITYCGPHDGVLVPLGDGREITVNRGETVDVPSDTARRLLEQAANWKRPPTPVVRKASTKAGKEKG